MGSIANTKLVSHFSEHEDYYSAFHIISKYNTQICLISEQPNIYFIGLLNTKQYHKMYTRQRSEASGSSKVSNIKAKTLS